MHLNDGQLRASLDNEISEKDAKHLVGCEKCQAHLVNIADHSEGVNQHLSALRNNAPENVQSLQAMRSRLESLISQKESQSMFKKVFSQESRPVWVGVGIVALLALAMAFAPVRAIANSFLGLFRIEQVTVVRVNPENFMRNIDASSNLEAIFAEDVQFSGEGEPTTVSNVDEASKLAGIAVRLPTEVEGELKLEVKSPMQMTFNVNTSHVQAILDELGQTDIKLPDGIDGATVTAEMPAIVSATYGDCTKPGGANPEGFDPDDPSTYPSIACVNLLQLESPTIDAPPGVNLQQIGQAYLELIGMEPDDAAYFSQNIDWSTTLVVPLPVSNSEYMEVSVDGVSGTLIRSFGEKTINFALFWVRDGIVYVLTGQGDVSTALAIANSIK